VVAGERYRFSPTYRTCDISSNPSREAVHRRRSRLSSYILRIARRKATDLSIGPKRTKWLNLDRWRMFGVIIVQPG
jgi:hypothetical protein